MEAAKFFPMGFYLWWLSVNGCLCLAEFHFIQKFIPNENPLMHITVGQADYVRYGTEMGGKRFVLCYVLLNELLTFLVMYYQSFRILGLLLHAGIIVGFSVVCLKMRWLDTIAPMMIILTLFTFMEGFQAVLMSWLSGQNMESWMAIIIQILVSGILAALLIMTLNYISKTYSHIGRQRISNYLYALLFPCVFIVWAIRSGLNLDMRMISVKAVLLRKESHLWALCWIVGTCAVFFILLKLADRIMILSIQETDQKRLEDRIKAQSIYLEEAKMRNEKYRRFQHDIDNHFLVLFGLIHEKKYGEAESYFDHLHKASDHLLLGIETGNPVIDVLLNEKIRYAESKGIRIRHDIRFTPYCPVEDMDLCVILANAIDNAIAACIKERINQPEISVVIRKRHHFIIIEITNPVNVEYQMAEYGTGLKNIKYTVEKYEGTMEIECGKNYFKLTALLCLKPITK